MFIVLLLSSTTFVAISILPKPFSIKEVGAWEATQKNSSKGAEAIDLDTTCAAETVGNSQSFIKDFWVLLSIDNVYAKIIGLEGGRHNIAPKVLINPDELKLIRDEYSKNQVVCVDKYCTSIVTPKVFENLISTCGKSLIQYYNLSSKINWRINKNIERSQDIWGWSLFIIVISLMSSVFYDKTMGRIVNWVIRGEP